MNSYRQNNMIQSIVVASAIIVGVDFYWNTSMANFAMSGRLPLEIKVQNAALDKLLPPSQSNYFDKTNGKFSLYVFPESVNGSVVVALRNNCEGTYCATLLSNLTWSGLSRSTILDSCKNDFISFVNIHGKTKHGDATGVINLTCLGMRGGLTPTGEEGFSDFVE